MSSGEVASPLLPLGMYSIEEAAAMAAEKPVGPFIWGNNNSKRKTGATTTARGRGRGRSTVQYNRRAAGR